MNNQLKGRTYPTLPRSHKEAIDQAYELISEIQQKALPMLGGIMIGDMPPCFTFEIEEEEGVDVIRTVNGCVTLSVEKTDYIGRAAFKFWVSFSSFDSNEDLEFSGKFNACREFVLAQMKSALNSVRID